MKGMNVREQFLPLLPLPLQQIIGPLDLLIPSSNAPPVTLQNLNESNICEFTKNWTSEKPSNQRFASPITIPVYKQLKLECNNLLREVNKQINDLEENIQAITVEDWCLRKVIVDNSLRKVNELTCTVSHPAVIKGITQRIRVARKKRFRRNRYREKRNAIGGENTDNSESTTNRNSTISLAQVEQLITGIVKLRNQRLSQEDNVIACTEFDDKVREFRDQIEKLK